MTSLMQRQAFSSSLSSVGRPTVAKVITASRSRLAVAPKALFGFGSKPKPAAGGAAAAPVFHICVDCGYIYDGGADFKTVPGSYKCPVCSSPKSRFKVYKGTDVKGKPNNSSSVMVKRKKEAKW